MNDTATTGEPVDQGYVLRSSLPMKLRLQEIRRALGSTDGLTCLEIGAENAAFSLQLRKHGGNWQSVSARADTAEAMSSVLNEKVLVSEDGVLPFKKKLFDVVVVVDFLERISNDVAFIEECHKVLKPDGRLIICAARIGHWMPVLFMRRVLGVTLQKRGRFRAGYSESELFRVLKTGFDVHLMRAFSRFFVEMTDTIAERVMARAREEGPQDRLKKVYAVAGVFYWIALQLDLLLLFSRGYRLIVVAKRRGWRSRQAPILVDGRSISEAVLSRAGQ